MNFTRGEDPKKLLNLGLYVYEKGFNPKWYVCNNCKSIKLERHHTGGFSPPYYICKDCGEKSHAPAWIYLDKKSGKPRKDNRVVYKDPISGKLVIPKKDK
jgi:ribosomal protein L37AE/L43A